jgi:NADPH:quinone reductase-like Zn-dependent oxidoreductase
MADDSMRALRARRPDPEALAVEQAPVPPAGIGDVLLRVQAASFTPTELGWPSTWVDRAGHERRPSIPGHEVAGVVAGLGSGTTGFALSDAVYGLTDWYRDGAAAEYVAVEARNLAPRPDLDPVQAAAVPLAGLTAYQALFDHGRLAAGQTVLVHGAGGGVGTFVVQLASLAGARVVATGRPWARDLVTDLGADVFVDVDAEPFEPVAGQVDLVVDLVGGTLLERSWSVLRAGGTLVSALDVPAPPAARAGDVHTVYFAVEPSRPELTELSRRIDAGDLRPIVGSVVPLEEGAQAFRAKQAGSVRGKAVLQVE